MRNPNNNNYVFPSIEKRRSLNGTLFFVIFLFVLTKEPDKRKKNYIQMSLEKQKRNYDLSAKAEKPKKSSLTKE